MEDWLKQAFDKIDKMPAKAKEVRNTGMEDLYFFAQLVNPGYVYGDVHREIYKWMEDYTLYGHGESLTANKLIMLPRAHLKSHMVATWCAWMIIRHPEITMLYVSATAELAQTQLYAIQNILCSSIFSRYYPEYIHPQEGKREKWSAMKIIVDHPRRKSEGVRDATIATAGLTTNTTGWHADVVVGDDLVVPENAYTEDGRSSVSKKSSQFTSIRNAGGFTMACGTRYHPKDIYATWYNQEYVLYNDQDEAVGKQPVWSVKEYKVEEDNIFVWPRTKREDGKSFGFDLQTLARIIGEYDDRTQFFAQYYNDPNDSSSNRIDYHRFVYADRKHLKPNGGGWAYKGQRLNVYASIDFAFSLNKKADYTAIVVIGIDSEGYIYVLDIARFKTDKIDTYFREIVHLHSKWSFKKLRAEVTVAQSVIARDLKDRIRADGLRLVIDEHRPSRHDGKKEERIAAALEHRYDNQTILHFKGGYTEELETELVQSRPKNDDIKDALASAVEIVVKPRAASSIDDFAENNVISIHPKFGGVAF